MVFETLIICKSDEFCNSTLDEFVNYFLEKKYNTSIKLASFNIKTTNGVEYRAIEIEEHNRDNLVRDLIRMGKKVELTLAKKHRYNSEKREDENSDEELAYIVS